MKYFKFLTLIAFLAGFTFMIGCGNDDDNGPSEEELQLEKLAGTWSVSSASLDGVDRTADWSLMTLTLTTSKSYSTSGSNDENVWPASGTWDFAGTTGAGLFTVNRSDGVTITIGSTLSESNMELSFTYALAAAQMESRVASIEGDWVFTFTK